jgi:AsmA family/AsmA-like C-terminal region
LIERYAEGWSIVCQGIKGMGTKRGKYLLIAGGVAVLVVIAAIAAFVMFDIKAFRATMESAAFNATGLEVRLKGKMALSFFPFGVTARDIHVAGKGGEFISIDSLRLGAELMPLLKKQLKVTSCELVKPVITIVKDVNGNYNFEKTEKKSAEGVTGAVFRLNGLKLSDGVLIYLDRKTGEKTEVREFNLAVRDISTAGNTLRSASFTGSFECKEIRKRNLEIDNVKSDVNVAKGIIRLSPLSMDIFGAKGKGDATADVSGDDALYKINVRVPMMDFTKFEEFLGTKKVIGGTGKLDASLTMREQRGRNPMSGMDGTLALRGDNLVIYSMDLDKVLTSYETSKAFNLVDLVAYLVAGPLSTVALKGYRYGDLYNQTREGQGTITQFVSHWRIRNGVADATDCALATRHNRVALKGRLDLVGKRFDNVVVALLDDKGCVKFKQSLSGPFSHPHVSATSRVETYAGPIVNLYRKTKHLIQGGRCEVFYNGAVQQTGK